MDFRLVPHGLVDSTSERAFAALAAGEARHGDVHVATGQTAGRGRRGRTWVSAEGEGLYLSLVLLPPVPPGPLSPTALTMAAGLAVLETCEALGLERIPRESWKPWPERALRLDWPNDLVAGGAKLCGILVESRGFDPARPHYVVGVGLNVRQREFPPELLAERAVTSLGLLGVETTPEAVRELLLDALGRRLADLGEDTAVAYLAATGLERRRVRIAVGERTYTGVLEELSLRGGISLRMAAGEGLKLMLEHVSAVDLAERPGA